MKLVDNWKDWWKMWTIRINIIFGILLTILSQFPEVFMQLWVIVPDQIKESIMTTEGITFAFIAALVISSIARLIKQEKLHSKKEDVEMEETDKKD